MRNHTHGEILSQQQAWTSALAALEAMEQRLTTILAANRDREVRFLGSGSSYYLGLAAACTWSRCGWPSRAIPSAEQVLNPEDYPSREPPLVIAVSRSGSTTETVRAVEMLSERGSATIGISTMAGGPLAEACDVLIEVAGGRERSTVQTRSFTGQLVAAKGLAFLAATDDDGLAGLAGLARQGNDWLERSEDLVRPRAMSFARCYLLGTGERWGLASEGALKLKETALAEAEAFQTLEFRHGPQSMVDAETLVIGLISESNAAAELEVLREVRGLGGQVLAIGEDLRGEEGIDTLSFRSMLPERSRSPLYLAPLQLLAYHRAVQRGLNPDKPRNLNFVVELAHL